ncbi:nucleolar pre-ribosomal-associated protein 1 [Gastrophryne carolinensis]
MMGKKRSSPEGGSPGPENKKAKSPEEEFTGTRFKSLLKEPSSAVTGLEQFLSLARKLPSPNLYDVVEGYIKISVECLEILKLLDGERRPESETMLIFQVLEAILLRTAGDLAHLSVAGVNIVKNLLNAHMKLLYASVYSETHRMSRICLNLLSAMVTQGPDCARDVFSHFDFNNKFLPGLLKKRDKQGRPDVRMAYIQFALSFLISGDNTIIVQVLELKDFFGEIFSTGIKEDRISTINLLLSLLQNKVIHNKAVTKTQKVRFFTSAILNHIASLYRWNGIVDVNTKDVQDVKDPKEAGKSMIRELVHNFLTDLCCSLKHGINFYDPSLGTAARAGNLVLLQFLVGLKSAAEDDLVGELVVNILKVCPDLLSRYFKETQYSFVPRLKTVWLDNIKLLKKIYEAQAPVSVAFKTTEFVPLPRLINMVMITTVAPVCSKSMLTQGLNVPNKIVKQTILSLITSILKRAEVNVNHCLKEDVWQKSDLYTPAVMAEFAQKYREALSKLLPDINTIVATWQSLLKQEETNGEKGEDGKTLEEKQPTPSGDFPVLTEKEDDLQTTLVKTSLLQVLCLYQRVVPHLVSQSNFDFSKLLKGIVNEEGVREEVPPVLQHQILQVALELPANKFSWFKVQEVSEAGGEKSVFYLLLKMFVTCNKTQLKSSTRRLIIKILRDSGVFEYTWRELELWLRCLDKVEQNSQEVVIQLLEQALVKLVSNPYPYTDKAAEYVQEASVLQSSLGRQDSDTVSIPISHIDDVMDMVDVIVEGSKGLDEEVGFTLDEEMVLQTFPFSAVVPVALESRNRILASGADGHECIIRYLVSILSDILHTQRDPLALCLMLQSYDKELQSSDKCLLGCDWLQNFWNYYSLWLPPSVRESPFPNVKDPEQDEGSSYSSLLKKIFVDAEIDDATHQSLKELIPQIPLEELPVAVHQTLLCIRTTVENLHKYKKSTGYGLISLYLDLLICLFCHYQQTEKDQKERREELKDSLLFTDSDNMSESPGNTVLEVMITAAFKHPTLESWFLALERQSVPPHNLNPVTVKLLSSAMSQGLIRLLETSAPLLQKTNTLHLLAKYFEGISVSFLQELETCQKTPKKASNQLEALQRLHLYMDTAQLNEIILAILKIPEQFLFETSAEYTHQRLSGYGQMLVELLADGHRRKKWQEDLAFSVEHIRGVGHLLLSPAGADLEPVITDALQKEPAYAHVVGVDVLTHCLDKMAPASLRVASLLLQHSATHRLQFELWCMKPGTEKLLKKNRELFVPIVNEYLKARELSGFVQLAKVSTAVLQVLKDVFWNKLVTAALSKETSDQSSHQIVMLSRLVTVSETNDLTKLLEELPGALSQTCSTEKWALADCVWRAAERAGEAGSSWLTALLTSNMKCLTAAYGANKECEEAVQDSEKALLSRLQNLMILVKENVPTEWNSFVKTGLKYRYKDCAFLDALCVGIEAWYKPDGPCTEGLVQLSVLHMMVTQHSLFLPNFLRSREEENIDNDVREKLVDLLRAIIRNCPSVCDKNHFAVLLGAYGGTLCVTDQKLLFLLQDYELNNLSLTDFRLLLWGPAAVEHHRTRKSLGKSLWQQPSMEEILSLLDRERMLETILNFPLHRKLTAQVGKSILYEDRAIANLGRIYDPCFLLPLFSELLRPELVVDCAKFVEVNALGLTLVALSSYDYNMRAAANHVLGSFVSHMEGARFRDKMQLQYLLDVMKNGIRQENLRLTFLLALYGARAAQLVFKPEEHMYIKINRFLLSHEYLEMKKVPDFYRLFYSSDTEHRLEREWILALLSDGMRDKHCYELYNYQRIFMVIMTFYNSPLCDETSQTQILEILTKASKVPKAAYELLRDHSLLTWIQNILEKRYVENNILVRVITLVNNLWFTNLGNKDKSKSKEKKAPDGLAEREKFLPIHMVNEFFGVAIVLLRHIRPNIDNIYISQYFCTLSSVLRYRSRVLEAFKEMGRFAVNEQVLSIKHTLLLLHKWSVIEKDLDLQERLNSLAKEHRIKELTSTIKEKFRQPGPRHLRRRNEAEQEEAIQEHQQVSHLDDARSQVKSILIHWRPTLLNLPEERTEDTDQLKEATSENLESDDRSDGSELMCASACLVAKFIIRAEWGAVVKSQDLCNSLQWLKSSILPQTRVVQELLTDGAWRSTLYKLYYNSATDYPDSSSMLLFNQVMMGLLEAQNLMTDSYQVMRPLLSLDDNTDHSQKAAASFLASLYIGDMWLGAASPVVLDTHVKLVCESSAASGSKQKTPRKARKKDLEAMASLCRDIAESLSNS